MYHKIKKLLLEGKSVHDVAVEINRVERGIITPKSIKDTLKTFNNAEKLTRDKNMKKIAGNK